MGGIVTQINPMLVARELENILQDSEAETIVVMDAFYQTVKAVQSNTNLKNIIVVSLQPSGAEFRDDWTFERFIFETVMPVEPVVIDPSHDVAVFQYTGGTTGRSKGAMLTHRNLVANIYQTKEFFKQIVDKGNERYLTVIPLFHVFGMTACMNNCISMASENILLPRFDIEEVLQTIKQEKPTIFPGVPTMYVAINAHSKAKEYGIDSIKISNSGSAPMPMELMRNMNRKRILRFWRAMVFQRHRR